MPKRHFLIYSILAIFFAINATNSYAADPSLSFSPSKISVNQNDEFQSKILIDTGGNEVGGVGAKLEYDANLIEIINIDTDQNDTFADYPTKSYDNTSGKATISGIVSSSTNLYNGAGTVATITFKAKNTGGTPIKFQFTPGSTTDSNIAVTYGNGDILAKVTNLDVTINQATSDTGVKIPTATPVPSSTSNRPTSVNLDPYAPIPSQAPNTDPNTQQPQTSGSIVSTPDQNTPTQTPQEEPENNSNTPLYIGIATVAAILIALVWIFIFKNKPPMPPQGPSQPQMPQMQGTTHQIKIPTSQPSSNNVPPTNNPASSPPQSTY